MFCEEPICKVWSLEEKQYDDEKRWEYFSYYFQPAYYVTEGKRLAFQTEHHYISVGADGVHIFDSKEEIEKSHLQLFDDDWALNDGYISEETFFFSGERMLDVIKIASGWEIEFDHLKLQVIPCSGESFGWDS